MTTKEIANKYYELASKGQWLEIMEKFHDDKIVCQEPEHVAQRGVPVITEGKEANKTKSIANRERIETIHSQQCSEPLVAGTFFTLTLKRDVTFKPNQRMQLEEVGVFEVKGDKIVLEKFFY
ncbi:MAG: SnoaL-like domain-containing protein [Chryseolinea sp.]